MACKHTKHASKQSKPANENGMFLYSSAPFKPFTTSIEKKRLIRPKNAYHLEITDDDCSILL